MTDNLEGFGQTKDKLYENRDGTVSSKFIDTNKNNLEISKGSLSYDAESTDFDEVIKKADLALYRGKHNSKKCVVRG